MTKVNKILICSSFFPPATIGGAEIVAYSQAKEMQKAGREVKIFSGYFNPENPVFKPFTENYEGLEIIRYPITYDNFVYNNLSYEYIVNFSNEKVDKYFKKVIDDFSPDVVHCHNILGLSLNIINISSQKGIPVYLTLHDNWGICHKSTLLNNNNELCSDTSKCFECMPRLKNHSSKKYVLKNIPNKLRKDFIEYTMSEKTNALISPSSFLANLYIRNGYNSKHIKVVWNGIDIEKFKNTAACPSLKLMRFTFIGHLGEHKGVHVLINAVKNYLPNEDNFIVNIVGEGSAKFLLEKAVNNEKLNNRIFFHGKISNASIGDILKKTDVLILPSIWPENQPVVIKEAMASSIPVIGTNIGGIPELIDDGKTGLLFKKGNSLELAEKMLFCIKNPEETLRMGKNAYEKIKNYSYQNQVRKIIDIYEKNENNLAVLSKLKIGCLGSCFEKTELKTVFYLQKLGIADKYSLLYTNFFSSEEDLDAYWFINSYRGIKKEISSILNKNKPVFVNSVNAGVYRKYKSHPFVFFYENEPVLVELFEYFLKIKKENK